MPLVQTRGAASAQGFGEFAQATAVNYIEDVFSTYLYTGNGSTQTITNGIDLSTKGGLVWVKSRSAVYDHLLFDTARGTGNFLSSNLISSASTSASTLTAFNTTGFSLGNDAGGWGSNISAVTTASWTFRKQPKFFDVVTWSPDGSGNATVAHSLNSVPGCVFIKKVSAASSWQVYHRSLTANYGLFLNDTDAATNFGSWISVSSTQLSMSGYSAGTYIAYLFAHDAGGFGLTGTDNVISCGVMSSITGGTTTVNLGYEPQWVMVKRTDAGGAGWSIADISRGMFAPATYANELQANTSSAESAAGIGIFPLATGFRFDVGGTTPSWIYIAIRRGPMKVPTDATKVFGLSARSGTGANATVTGGQTDDAVLVKNRGSAVASLFSSRLTGTGYLVTSSTAAEVSAGTTILQANPWDVMDGVKVGTTSTITNASANTFINYLFRRAPGFFDEVCYTGTGVAGRTVTHNLTVAPELMIVKGRSDTGQWRVYASALGATQAARLNATDSFGSNPYAWNNTAPTSSVFTVGDDTGVNENAYTYVAYLFATCAGVSKVGSYTGTGTTLQIDCGFTAGARFVLIKRTDSTGDWYVWDSARGIVAGNDPYLLLNSTAAEVTSTDYVDTYSAGFEISSTAPAAINASAGTFIFLAIA